MGKIYKRWQFYEKDKLYKVTYSRWLHYGDKMNSETGYVDAFLDQISEDYKSNEPKIEKTDVKIIFGLTFAVQCPMLQGATSELIRKYEPVIKEHQREIEVNYFSGSVVTHLPPLPLNFPAVVVVVVSVYAFTEHPVFLVNAFPKVSPAFLIPLAPASGFGVFNAT